MTFIVTEPCVNCRYTDCVSVCPVDCFHQGPNFIVIDPEACIDCGVCVDECPVDAICDAASVPTGQEVFVELNARYAAIWPLINERGDPLPDAEAWAEKHGKRGDLIEA